MVKGHDELEEHFQDELDWPEFYHHYHPGSDVPDVYYRIEGPNGPATYKNPGGHEVPTTMRSVVLEAASGEFEPVFKEATPFGDETEDNDKAMEGVDGSNE